MTIDTTQVLSISEVNQNFSRATRIVDKQGSAVIFKNKIFFTYSIVLLNCLYFFGEQVKKI